MVGTICENAGFGPGVKERGRYNVLPASIVKFTAISVIMQISTSVPRTTEVVALSPNASTLQEATGVPAWQDTSGMDSLVQVCK